MPHAIRIHEHGGPEVLRWEEIEVDDPTGRQVLLRQQAVGLNFFDLYFRKGLYRPAGLPFIPGQEGAGIVEAVGPDVQGLSVGDRVMYARGPFGAYAEARLMDEDDLLRIPGGIGFEHAAASLLRGLTAQFLLNRVIGVQPGMTLLVHAAAGGVGLLLCQWGKHLGARIIGTAGSPEKAALAREHGADEVILYKEEDIATRVMEITMGEGVNVVYDAVGESTFEASLASLRRFGLLVCYGQASGKAPSLEVSRLTDRSLFLTRPTLKDYAADVNDYRMGAVAFLDLVLQGVLRISVGQSYYLSDAATAQADLEAGRTKGASVLIVG